MNAQHQTPYKDVKKVIHLNPEHLNVSSAAKPRTRKRGAPQQVEAISPILRQKALLRRIKDSRMQQLEHLTSEKTAWTPRTVAHAPHHQEEEDEDEFADSMSVLKTFAAVRANPEQERAAYEYKKHTAGGGAGGGAAYNPYRLKNHHPAITPPTHEHQTMPHLAVNIHSPKELMPSMAHFSNLDSVIPTYNVDSAVPYGVLRNGIKPTYRNWVKSAVPAPMGTASPSPVNARLLAQRKIQLLREKYRAAAAAILANPDGADEGTALTVPAPAPFKSMTPRKSLSFDTNPPSIFETVISEGGNGNAAGLASETTAVAAATTVKGAPFKKVIRKTFKRKHILGRSKTAKSIGVLIKNTTVRNNIIDAHKELRNHSIADVKRYLREHNLIKIGCDAPNDVLRSLYENAILTGDVVNINGSTLLHNFTNAKAGEHVVDGLEPMVIESLFMDNDRDSATLG